jgi:V/A-type H+-transporting ATPase subunit D
MARLALNKSSLTKQKKQLKTFQDFLPSLDLKRRQLVAEQAKARKAVAATQQRLTELESDIGRNLTMLANEWLDLTDLVKVTDVKLSEENVVGTRLPKLEAASIQVRDYSLLGKPQWVDRLVEDLKAVIELRLQAQVAARQLELLDGAVRTITQRVNLFDKVLIPRTKRSIKKIQIYLSDAERAGVINAKIAKRKMGVNP